MDRRDRAFGAYIGAAIGDAMGGPVETSHARRIKRLVGEITGLLSYRKPWTRHDSPRPGYALRFEAGAVTDDTFIRGDITRFLIQTRPPRTPAMLVDWCLTRADFSMWWPPIVEGLRRVHRGEVSAENGGLTFFQGGGVGWWTPVGVLHGGDPDGAALETRSLSRPWKAPLEQDLLAATQAAVAEGMRDGATVDSMVRAMYRCCGSLGRRLLDRAVDAAAAARSVDDLAERIYATMLMPELDRREIEEPPRDREGPMPPITPPCDTDERYISSFFAEQVPISLAGFLFGHGEPRCVPVTVMMGRDCDSTATTVGSWVGALHGESGLPRHWVDTVCRVNVDEIDIRGLAEALIALPA